MNELDQFEEKVNFRLFNYIRMGVKKQCRLDPDKYPTESDFYRIATIKELNRLEGDKDEVRN